MNRKKKKIVTDDDDELDANNTVSPRVTPKKVKAGREGKKFPNFIENAR